MYSDELSLGENSLTGMIPSEIGLLQKLTDLSLYSNQLFGSIPTVIGLLNSLNWMYLEYNNLVGTIPSEIALLNASLSKFFVSAIFSFNFSFKLHTHFRFHFDATAELYLKYNSLSGTILTTIGSLTKLGESISLSVPICVPPSKASHISDLFVFCCTEEMHLNENNFTRTIPSELGSLTSVKRFLLGANKLTGTIPTELLLLTSMTVFFLNENSLTGRIPNGIGDLTSLVSLSLRDNELTGTIPSGIHNKLTNLKTLYLQNNNLIGPFTCPVAITNCKVSCDSDDDACRVL